MGKSPGGTHLKLECGGVWSGSLLPLCKSSSISECGPAEAGPPERPPPAQGRAQWAAAVVKFRTTLVLICPVVSSPREGGLVWTRWGGSRRLIWLLLSLPWLALRANGTHEAATGSWRLGCLPRTCASAPAPRPPGGLSRQVPVKEPHLRLFRFYIQWSPKLRIAGNPQNMALSPLYFNNYSVFWHHHHFILGTTFWCRK